jgi:hypothetical protein
MTRRAFTIALAMLLLWAGRGLAQQRHAPAGGTTVNGKFYAGGQFLPKEAGFSSGSGGSFDASIEAPPGGGRRSKASRARTTARSAFRTEAREQVRARDPDVKARGDISIARMLVKQGKDVEAAKWLAQVSQSNVSRATADEARAMLADFGKKVGQVSSTAPAQGNSSLAVGGQTGERTPCLEPEKARIRLASAQSLEKSGKSDQALAEYRRVLREYPGCPVVRPASERIAAINKAKSPLSKANGSGPHP